MMLSDFNKKITLVAIQLDQRIGRCSLLNIPESQWKVFTQLVYVHFVFATILFVLGIICFCLGMQYSGMYTEVNCTDGTNIWIPLLNLIVSFSGLFTLRTLHLHWPAFIHWLGLCIMLLAVLVPVIDSALASARWFARISPRLDCWATNFSLIDLSLSLIAAFNEVLCILMMLILLKYWYRPNDRSQEDSPNANTS